MAAHPQATSELHIRRPVWKALETHYKRVRDLHLGISLPMIHPWGTHGRPGSRHLPGLLKESITDHTLKLPQLAEESGLQARIDAMFRGKDHNTEEGQSARSAALHPARLSSLIRKRGSTGACGTRQDDSLLHPCPQRRMERLHRQAHSQRHQHRYRRLRSGTCDGI